MTNDKVTRRDFVRTGAVAGSAAAVGSMAPGVFNSARGAAVGGSRPTFRNDQFYTNGQFDEQKAKEGVLAMCRWFGYPVFPGMLDMLWVSDYGTGQFSQLGLAACVFANHRDEAAILQREDRP